ncbi:MAG: hypothetical protein ABH827_02645, partial [bacterium]
MPKIAEYRTAYFRGQSFPDCADTTIRNLVNICLFAKDKIFSITNLHADEQKNVDTKIKEFYNPANTSSDDPKKAAKIKKNLCILPDEVENQAVHNAWTEVIPSCPFVSYNRILDTETNQTHITGIDSSNAGAISGVSKTTNFGDFKDKVKWLEDKLVCLGTAFDAVEIAGKKYFVIDDPRYVLYEIRPSIKNMIILLTQFLGLNLYGGKKIEEIFADPNFNTNYFDPLCNTLGWQFNTNALGALDKQDYTPTGVSFPVAIKSGEQFTLTIHLGHAYVKKSETVKELPAYKKNIFASRLETLKPGAPQIKETDLFLRTNIFGLYNDVSKFDEILSYLKNKSWLGIHLFFLRDILDNNTKLEIIKSILKSNHEWLMELAEKLIASLPVGQDFYYQKNVFKILAEDIGTASPTDTNKLSYKLLFNLNQNNPRYKILNETILIGFTCWAGDNNLFNAFITKAINFATDLANNLPPDNRSSLLNTLISKDATFWAGREKELNTLIASITDLNNNLHPDNRYYSLDTLISKDATFWANRDEKLDALIAWITDLNNNLRPDNRSYLLNTLISKDATFWAVRDKERNAFITKAVNFATDL